jgi:hypothetical protein
MNAKQIQTAGITVAKAESATMGNVIQLPGEVRFNEDLRRTLSARPASRNRFPLTWARALRKPGSGSDFQSSVGRPA